jgi:hypothetical protein
MSTAATETLALPSPTDQAGENGEGKTQTLMVGGEAIKLDHLGPVEHGWKYEPDQQLEPDDGAGATDHPQDDWQAEPEAARAVVGSGAGSQVVLCLRAAQPQPDGA